ncbi:MAG: AMP-binding protein, partial [Cytophagales bacterium]|nr:AMP-binding protein [Cytophagales bacterium]
AEKFVVNPLNGQRMYKSGDLGRWLDDGLLRYEGRTDRQVKIRGHRVEVGEVEYHLLQFGPVSNAVVVPSRDKDLLLAYVVGKGPLPEAELRAYLARKLPAYMLPAAFIPVPEIPLTRNGKVDFAKLPAPGTLAAGRQYVAPRNETEAKLAAIWADVFARERVGVDDNFFDMGGHSLKAIQVITRLNKCFGTKIEVARIFEHPTVAGLAGVIPRTQTAGPDSIEPLEPAPHYDLSPAQRRLWLLHAIDKQKNSYNIPSAFVFTGLLERGPLEEAFYALIARHEILRTRFVLHEDLPRQVVCRPEETGFRVEFIDARGDAAGPEKVQAMAAAEAAAAFDLAAGPLMRAKVIRLEEAKCVFLLTLHHIISDGWSNQVLFDDLVTLYNAYRKQEANPLTPLPIQYKDYAAWQNALLSDEEKTRQHRQYWMAQFADQVPVLELPTDFPRPPVKTYHGDSVALLIGRESSDALHQFCRVRECSLFMVLLASLKVLLYRYTGQKDLVVGTPTAGRLHPDLENQVGCYVNTLAIRSQIGDADTFEALLGKMKANLLDAYSHQVYPFDTLVDDLNVERDLSRMPLFDVMAVLQNYGQHTRVVEGSEAEGYGRGLQVSKFDLTFIFAETPEGIRVGIEYNTDLFERRKVEQLSGHYQALVEAILAHAGRLVSGYDLLGAEEKHTLLTTFNDTATPFAGGATVVNLFEEQARRTPEAVALLFGSRQLNYRQLDEQSNQVAHYLRDYYRVASQAVVALMMDRSEQLIVVLLGILKAGAAYLPSDPSYPPDRVRFLLEDASVGVF